MGDQLQPVQPVQKWYAKPQVLMAAAAIGYLFSSKKTRKIALYATAAGAAYFVYGLSQMGKMTNRDRIAMQGPKMSEIIN